MSAGDGLVEMLLRLVEELRAARVPVAMVEVLDATEALRHVDVADRPLLRAALRASLVKHPEDEAVFDALFERCFALSRDTAGRPPASASRGPSPAGPDGPTPRLAEGAALHDELLRALHDRDDRALHLLAAEAVAAYAGIGEVAGSEQYFLFRVLRALDLAALMVAAMQAERAASGEGSVSELELRLRRDELARRLDDLRRLLALEVRRALHGGNELPPVRRLDDLDVQAASFRERHALRQAVRPLARKLAGRVAQRHRRHRRGRLDMRRTARRSLSSGGVPFEPAFRRRRVSRPDVVVLCDLSGSVAEFAGFTLGFVHALHAELAHLRSFVFVDGLAEVTELLEQAGGVVEPFHLLARSGVISGDGHSDYGRVFERFWIDHAPAAVSAATTVIVTGDARTNYRPAGTDAFARLCRRAKRVYWFNPERRAEWDTTDSAMAAYAATCTDVFEVRTLRDLSAAVAAIL